MNSNTKLVAVSTVLVLLFFSCANHPSEEETNAPVVYDIQHQWAVVVHGGAGDFSNTKYTEQEEADHMHALQTAIDSASFWLKAGKSAVDVAEATVALLEDCPLFNAGRGAVFTAEGTNELDASIMDGSNLKAGAVCGLKGIKNPIKAARAVMDSSRHVMLSGEGARLFAAGQGLQEVDETYFKTQRSYEAFLKAKEKATSEKLGTVGCVVLDKSGNLAAGTSTGGMMMKQFGRVGDTPIIGAGTYADNKTCAVSCTGHGEFFIRVSVAHDIAARMEYGGRNLQEAAREVVQQRLVEMGGSGGIIAVDSKGEMVLEFNTAGMFRGFARSDGSEGVFMYK